MIVRLNNRLKFDCDKRDKNVFLTKIFWHWLCTSWCVVYIVYIFVRKCWIIVCWQSRNSITMSNTQRVVMTDI